ncbi:MAG TPA: Crp/Fnr family transcriptional regulator [Saprospiraceae bacterium]|nr:Crp/Fnr family transcriptional regulator [Saprospiraceae bacterium]HRG20970.1 Crp/Fnr family transcriptional regulator [Saprospiraceae bacterium]HRG65262.1 Crp/Fnr family transcriptional regulator [Saprospiraceae bacterium]
MGQKGLSSEILQDYGAQIKFYSKGDIVFKEDTIPRYFHQIDTGCVKMISHGEDGRTFTQGIFTDGQCFGEPPLVINALYPATAQVITDSQIIRLTKDSFEKMLLENSSMCHQLNLLLATRAYEKTKTNMMLTGQAPEIRIGFILDKFKTNMECLDNQKNQICLTRQEIADFTGLRVETVIRTLKRMETENKIEIRNRKLYY